MGEYVKRISQLERLRSSVNGNPRYRIYFTDASMMDTMSDASINYGIKNPEYRNGPVKVFTTRAGKVWNIEVWGSES